MSKASVLLLSVHLVIITGLLTSLIVGINTESSTAEKWKDCSDVCSVYNSHVYSVESNGEFCVCSDQSIYRRELADSLSDFTWEEK